jgi:hypothetical protein
MGADGYSSERSEQLSAKVDEALKRDFRDACDNLDVTMTDAIEGLMEEFVAEHGPSHTGETTGHYPDDAHLRELYEACLDAADGDFKLYQRRHAGQVAQATRVSKTDLPDALMPLRRAGYVALGAMPVDMVGEAAARWRHWHVKPPEADPDQWTRREGGR